MKGLLSVTMLAMLLGQSAFAADPEPSDETPYTFQVSLSAGDQGTFGTTDKKEAQNITAGAMVDFSNYQSQLQILDEKYYAKGIRLSGRDNSETTYFSNWKVTGIEEDADYVVAYGMRENMVAYTVQYLDENGNELAPAQTFYGSVGDKPVVAFQYIEGYLPQAYNLTKTLSSNEADNVFPFVYTPSSETQNIVVTTDGGVTVVTTPATGTTAATTGTAAGGTAAAGTGTAAAGTADQGTTAGEAQDAGDTATIDEDQTPQGTVDLDEDDVPLGNKKADESVRETSAVPIVLGVIGAIAAVVIIAGAVIYFRKHS